MMRRNASRGANALRLVSGSRKRSNAATERALIRRAEQILELRRQRADQFGSMMFGEPAWEMLLAAYIGEQRHDWATTANLTTIAGVSHSVALRWLTFLLGEGLVEQDAHPKISDLLTVRLTDRSHQALERYLTGTFAEWPA